MQGLEAVAGPPIGDHEQVVKMVTTKAHLQTAIMFLERATEAALNSRSTKADADASRVSIETALKGLTKP
jgi:hypothetical protein